LWNYEYGRQASGKYPHIAGKNMMVLFRNNDESRINICPKA
jgi:hypothetical protein